MAKTLITTPFPSAAYIAEKLGLPSSRIERLERLIAEIQGESRTARVYTVDKRGAAAAAKPHAAGAAKRRAAGAAKRRFADAARHRAASASKTRWVAKDAAVAAKMK